MKQSHIDTIIEEIAKSEDISVQEAAKKYVNQSDYAIDFDNLPKQKHSWTMRGLKATCEFANHPHHEVWFRKEQK